MIPNICIIIPLLHKVKDFIYNVGSSPVVSILSHQKSVSWRQWLYFKLTNLNGAWYIASFTWSVRSRPCTITINQRNSRTYCHYWEILFIIGTWKIIKQSNVCICQIYNKSSYFKTIHFKTACLKDWIYIFLKPDFMIFSFEFMIIPGLCQNNTKKNLT